MTIKKVLKILNDEFPGKGIFPNKKNKPTEIICEVEPAGEHPGYSVAIAYIKETPTHRHAKSTEVYEAEDGLLNLYLDGVKRVLKPGESQEIKPGVIHQAEGNWTRIRVTSKPGWIPEDQIPVERAVSAGGIVTKDGKIIFVEFPEKNGVTFPKGHLKKGESFEETAIREVAEETGLGGLKVVKNLGIVTRPSVETDGRLVLKDIHLFLMKTNNFDTAEKEEATVWLTPDEVYSQLYPQEAEFLKKHRREIGV